MRFVRFGSVAGESWGTFENGEVTEIVGSPFQPQPKFGHTWKAGEVRFLPPALPRQVICLGLNYRSVADALRVPVPAEPVIFFKPTTTLARSGQPIELPSRSQDVVHEAELALVISRDAYRLHAKSALEHVWGYTCANDVTARDIQTLGGNFMNINWSKSYGTFLPIGPWVETADVDPSELTVECYVNGKRRQSGKTSDMVFSVPELVSWISNVMPLFAGDVICTGTPLGFGRIVDGDVVEVRIDGIGTLENPVVQS